MLWWRYDYLNIENSLPMTNFVFENPLLTQSDPVSRAFISRGIHTFHEAIDYVHQCSYGRSLDQSDMTSVLHTGQGTCSSKHALLAQLALLYQIKLQLQCAIISVEAENMPTIAPLLNALDINFFPEAHCFLEGEHGALDVTFKDQSIQPKFKILAQITLCPDEMRAYKVKWHQNYLKKWMKDLRLDQHYSLDDIWQKREAWIKVLSQLEPASGA